MFQLLLRLLYAVLWNLSIVNFMIWLVDRSLQSCAKAVESYSDCRGVSVCNFNLLLQSSLNAFAQRVARYGASIPPENCHQSYCGDASGRRSSRSGSTRVCPLTVCLISFRWRPSKVGALIQDMMLLEIWKATGTIRKPSIFPTSPNVLFELGRPVNYLYPDSSCIFEFWQLSYGTWIEDWRFREYVLLRHCSWFMLWCLYYECCLYLGPW